MTASAQGCRDLLSSNTYMSLRKTAKRLISITFTENLTSLCRSVLGLVKHQVPLTPGAGQATTPITPADAKRSQRSTALMRLANEGILVDTSLPQVCDWFLMVWHKSIVWFGLPSRRKESMRSIAWSASSYLKSVTDAAPPGQLTQGEACVMKERAHKVTSGLFRVLLLRVLSEGDMLCRHWLWLWLGRA